MRLERYSARVGLRDRAVRLDRKVLGSAQNRPAATPRQEWLGLAALVAFVAVFGAGLSYLADGSVSVSHLLGVGIGTLLVSLFLFIRQRRRRRGDQT